MKTFRICATTAVLCLMLCACATKAPRNETSAQAEAQPIGDTAKTTQVVAMDADDGVDAYRFYVGDVALYPDQDVTTFPALDAAQTGYFEEESCAALGIAKLYAFRDFEVYTYPDDDVDRIQYIFLKTDRVSTFEGADLAMNENDVIALYGDGYETKGDALIYRRGKMRLAFAFDERRELTAIEYRSDVME